MAQQRIGRIQWGDLTFGPGSRYHVTAIEGLDDLPDIRSDDMERPGQHGDYTGPDYTGPRVIQLGLGLRGDTPDELRDLTLALRAATQPQRAPAPMQLLDQDTVLYGKIRRRSIPYDAEYLWRTGTAALELYCADPYLYGLEEHSASTTAYSPAAGRTYPLAYSGVAPATNFVFNPSAAVDLSNTANYGANMTRTVYTAEAWHGDTSILHTHSGATIAGTSWSIAPQPGGTTISIGAWVKPLTGTYTRGNLAWRSGTATLQTVSLTPQPAGVWSRVTATYTLAPGETCDNIGLSFEPTAAGATWLADAAMASPAPVLPSYGDGSMTGYGWAWSGAANASASVRTITGTGRAYGSAGESGRLSVTNNGSADAYPVLRLDGPVANPAVEQVNTGAGITLDATLADGEYVLIDTRTRAVLYMGTSPRRSWVRAGSVWPTLPPGTSTFAYRGSALPGSPGQSSLLTITWRDTSL
ncbi:MULTISPECIES: phage distal tail protein [unclassified Streptomyces]|uniref:phage distal tail protein n=1 Tax=unclassified Streptomyces TaxID=2593676 RepID=UPI00093B776E|nr:phage tail domain-containing protein [Streptomyces sp. CB02366]